MKSKGVWVSLADICINRGEYGIAASAVDYDPKLISYLRISDIRDDGSLDLASRKSVADPKAEKYMLLPNDIVFARTGNSTGRNYFYDPRDGKFAYAGFLIKFSIDPKLVNPRYIKYYCQSSTYWNWVASFNSGSTRGNINAKTYSFMPIFLPSRCEQDCIVKICDSISDKIRVNNRINDYLAELGKMIWAQTAKQAAKTVKIAEVAADIVTGKTPSTKKPDNYGEEYPFITIPDIHSAVWLCSTERCLSEVGNSSQPKKLVQRGSVLVSCIATVGLVGIVQKPSHFNQQINAVIPANEGDEFYLYYAMHSIKQELLGIGATGSATLNVNKGAFSNIEIPWPERSAMDTYVRTVEPLFKAIEANTLESLRLQELRDTLLPKLMSGEIDVSKVEI